MNIKYYYWLITAVFTMIHLDLLFTGFDLNIPFYFIFILTAFAAFLLSKKIILFIQELGMKTNFHVCLFQLLILLLNTYIAQPLARLLLFLLFIGIELLRHYFARRVYSLKKLSESQNIEIKQMNETFRVVRSERHDFLKHISALHYMMEKKEYKDANHYLNDLVEGYKETNFSIQGERGTIAGILHQIYQKGKYEGIEIVYDLEAPISSLPLSDTNLTALLGNILDNALEACTEWQKETGKKASLTLQSYKRSGLFILTCQNSTLPIPNNILDNLFRVYGITTKAENHEGLGTKIIADIVKEGQGYLDFVQKDKMFTIKLKLPIILDTEISR